MQNTTRAELLDELGQLAALEETFSVLTARHRAERDRFAALLGIGGAEAQPMDGAEDGPETA